MAFCNCDIGIWTAIPAALKMWLRTPQPRAQARLEFCGCEKGRPATAKKAKPD